jgi:hypothetical protein
MFVEALNASMLALKEGYDFFGAGVSNIKPDDLRWSLKFSSNRSFMQRKRRVAAHELLQTPGLLLYLRV